MTLVNTGTIKGGSAAFYSADNAETIEIVTNDGKMIVTSRSAAARMCITARTVP